MESFPEDFIFRLSSKEWEEISFSHFVLKKEYIANSSQIVMSSKKHRGATYLPYAFIEHDSILNKCVKK
jgi:hypothetical protein